MPKYRTKQLAIDYVDEPATEIDLHPQVRARQLASEYADEPATEIERSPRHWSIRESIPSLVRRDPPKGSDPILPRGVVVRPQPPLKGSDPISPPRLQLPISPPRLQLPPLVQPQPQPQPLQKGSDPIPQPRLQLPTQPPPAPPPLASALLLPPLRPVTWPAARSASSPSALGVPGLFYSFAEDAARHHLVTARVAPLPRHDLGLRWLDKIDGAWRRVAAATWGLVGGLIAVFRYSPRRITDGSRAPSISGRG